MNRKRTEYELYSGNEKIDFDSRVDEFVENVENALFKDSDDSGIRTKVLPLCARLYGRLINRYQNDTPISANLVREMVSMAVLGFVFSEWLDSNKFEVREETVVLSVDEEMKLCTDLVEKVKEQVGHIEQIAINQLAQRYEIDPGKLVGRKLEEVPNVIRGELEESDDRNI